EVARAVGVTPLEADVALLLIRKERRVSKGVATMFRVGVGTIAGAVVGHAQERADRFRAFGELFEECASLHLSGFVRRPGDVLAFAPSEQSSFPCLWRASDQAAAERRAQSLAFRLEPRRCQGRRRWGYQGTIEVPVLGYLGYLWRSIAGHCSAAGGRHTWPRNQSTRGGAHRSPAVVGFGAAVCVTSPSFPARTARWCRSAVCSAAWITRSRWAPWMKLDPSATPAPPARSGAPTRTRSLESGR